MHDCDLSVLHIWLDSNATARIRKRYPSSQKGAERVDQLNSDRSIAQQWPLPKPWGFHTVCGVVLAGLLVMAYAPYVRGWSLGGVLFLAACMSGIPSGLAVIIRNRRTSRLCGVVMNDEGIRFRRRFMRWTEIERIEPCFNTILLLGPKGPKVKFFSFSVYPERRSITLPGDPSLYWTVLPAIVSRRPDVQVSKAVRRRMAGPERNPRARRLSILAALCLNAATLLLAYFVSCQGLTRTGLLVIAPLSLLPLVSAILLSVFWPTTAQLTTATCSFTYMVVVASVSNLFHIAPVWSLHALIAAAGIVNAAGFVVALAPHWFNRWTKGAVLALLIGLPAAIGFQGRATVWPRRDIGHLMTGDVAFPIWGRSGKYLCPRFDDDKPSTAVLEFPSLSPVPVAAHTDAMVVYLDRDCLIRRVRIDDDRAVYVHSFQTGDEIKLPARYARVLTGPSPDGRLLVWSGKDDCNDVSSLYVHDLTGDRHNQPIAQPPEMKDLYVLQAAWRDSQTFVLVAKSRAGEDPNGVDGMLHRWGVNPANGEFQHTTPAAGFGEWRVSPDCRHAFGLEPTDPDAPPLCYVDLNTGGRVVLTPDAEPVWQGDSTFAFRLIRTHDGTFLARFDVNGKREQLLHRVDDKLTLCDVSPQGRFALYSRSGTIVWQNVMIQDIASGKSHRLYVPGLTLISDHLRSFRSTLSSWSPDDRHLLLASLRMPAAEQTVLLYTVPDNWP